MSVLKTEENYVTGNSKEFVGITEYLTLYTRYHIIRCRYKRVTLYIHLWCHLWQFYSNKGQARYLHLHIPWLYETSKIPWLASILAIINCGIEWDGANEIHLAHKKYQVFLIAVLKLCIPLLLAKLVHWLSNNWILENDSASWIWTCNVDLLHEYKK